MADGQIKIEIDASMGGLQSAINNAKKKLQDLAKTADSNSDSISKAMDDAVKDIKKSFDGLSDVDLSKIKEALQDSVTEGESTAKAFDSIKDSAQNLESQQTSLRARLKEIQQAMADMQLAGKQDSAEFQAMAIEAGRLRDAIGDAQTRISALANDNQGIQALSSAMSGLAGAGSAATGAVSLLGDSSDDLQKVMVKLQSVMAITNGLQAVANTLNKDSATSIYAQVTGSKLLNTIKQNAYPIQQAENKAIEENTVAVKANNVAKGQGVTATAQDSTAKVANTAVTNTATTANFSLAGAIKGVGLAIKTALGPFGLIATAVGGLVALYMKLTSESRKWGKTVQEVNEEASKATSTTVASLTALRIAFETAYKAGNGEQWVKDNKASFDEYKAEINSVEDALKFFSDEQQKNITDMTQGNNEVTSWTQKLADAEKKVRDLETALVDYNKQYENYNKLAQQASRTPAINVGSSATAMAGFGGIDESAIYASQASSAKSNIDATTAQLEQARKERKKIEDEIAKSTQSSADAQGALGYSALANQKALSAEELQVQKNSANARFAARQAEIDNMEGLYKEEQQAELDHQKKLSDLRFQRADLEVAQNNGTKVDQAEFDAIDSQIDSEMKNYQAKSKSLSDEFSNYVDQSLSEYERRLAELDKQYAKDTAQNQNEKAQNPNNQAYYDNNQIAIDRQYAQDRADIMREQSAQEISLWKETEEAKVAQMTDTTQKQIAGYQLAHAERLKQIEAETQALIEQNKGDASVTAVEDTGLTQEQLDSQNAQRIKADEEYKASLVAMFGDLEKQYDNFYDQLLAKQQEYSNKSIAIETANQEGLLSDDETSKLMQSEGTQEGLGLAELARQASEASAEYDATAQEILEKTIDNLTTVAGALKEQIEQLKKTDPNNPNIAKLEASYSAVAKEINKAEGEEQDLEKAQKKASWDKTSEEINKCGNELKSLGNSIGGVAGDIVSLAGECLTTASTIITAITTLSVGSMTAMEGTAIAASTAIQMVEKASVILAVISAAMQVVQGIVNLFKSEKESVQDVVDAYERYADAINDCIDRKKELLETQVGDDVLDTVADINKYYEQLNDSSRATLSKYMNTRERGSHSVGYNINKKMNDTAWNQLADNLGTTVEGAKELVGGGYFNNLEDLSNETLRIIRDTPAVWAAFDDTTQECINNILDAEDGLTDSTNLMVESITGLSFEDLADNFKDTFQDMEATAEDFAQNFKDIMWQSISNQAFGTSGYNEWLEDWQTRLANATTASDDKELERLYQEAVDKAQELDDQQNELLEKYSYLQDDLADDASTLSGALSSASQESIDLLAGQTNACRINQLTEIDIMREAMESTTALINQQNAIQNNTLGALQDAVDELVLIRVATQTCADYSETMNRALNSIDGSCSEMASGYDFRAYGNVS